MPLMLLGLVSADCTTPANCPPHVRQNTGHKDAIAVRFGPEIDPGCEAGTVALAQFQHAILCRYAALGDVLPVALGSVFSDGEALSHHIRTKLHHLQHLERRLSGRVEYTLAMERVEAPCPTEKAHSGRAHLRQKAQARLRRSKIHAERRAFVENVTAIIGEQADAHRLVAPAGESRLARLDFLIVRDRLDACKHSLEIQLPRAERLELGLSLTGPYPAFSFLSAGEHVA